MTTITKQLAATILILSATLALLFLSTHKLPLLDTQTDHYFKETVTDATLAYATTRGVNAVVSVLKESELSLSPAGIGLTVAVGQILDPIDDMTERLSSVLVVSIVSLGLQKIINDIGGAISFQFMALLFPFFIIPVWVKNRTVRLFVSLIGRIITLAVILRLLLPISSIVNNSMYQHIFSDQVLETREKLNVISSQYKDLSSFDSGNQHDGIISKFARNTNNKIESTKKIFVNILDNAESIITSLIRLTILYVTLFITQVVLIPVVMLWFLIKAFDTIFMTAMLRKFAEIVDGTSLQARQSPKKDTKE